MTYQTIKIYLTIALFVITNKFYSQLNISWKLDQKKENAEVTISNTSKKNLAIAIDTLSLQAYFNDNNIMYKKNWNNNYPFLALTVNIHDDNNNKLITNTNTPYYDISEFDEIKRKKDSVEKKYDNIIKKWKLENKIQDLYFAQVNYYILKNLLLIKAKSKINFSVRFDLRNITNSESGLHDSYLLEPYKKYTSYLTLIIDKSLQNYLTKDQKQKLNGYKFFTGSIVSNNIDLKGN